jgi:nucleotide-binding universal stress UspA family protein
MLWLDFVNRQAGWEKVVSYSTLMVHLELGKPNAGLLAVAGDLAERFHAHVIGIAACQPMQFVYGMGYVSADFFERDMADLRKDSQVAETEFRSALQSRAESLEWRSTVEFGALSGHIAHEARSSDLVITSVESGGLFEASRLVNTGDLIMQVGRPVLVVPPGGKSLSLDRVLIAWKDTRETRRAILDALPLLKKAAHVTLAEIAVEDRLALARKHLEEVVVWLGRHGVKAEGAASLSTGEDASQLYAIAKERGADVIVAGAYGHSRLREWVLGGVTRDLLLRADLCAFVSH